MQRLHATALLILVPGIAGTALADAGSAPSYYDRHVIFDNSDSVGRRVRHERHVHRTEFAGAAEWRPARRALELCQRAECAAPVLDLRVRRRLAGDHRCKPPLRAAICLRRRCARVAGLRRLGDHRDEFAAPVACGRERQRHADRDAGQWRGQHPGRRMGDRHLAVRGNVRARAGHDRQRLQGPRHRAGHLRTGTGRQQAAHAPGRRHPRS